MPTWPAPRAYSAFKNVQEGQMFPSLFAALLVARVLPSPSSTAPLALQAKRAGLNELFFRSWCVLLVYCTVQSLCILLSRFLQLLCTSYLPITTILSAFVAARICYYILPRCRVITKITSLTNSWSKRFDQLASK